MTHSYKDGYREGVIFLFYNKDNKKILIEHRPISSNSNETFIPSGSIEIKDHIKEKDYRIVALFREVKEEFREKVNFKSYVPLCEYDVEEIKIKFYTYLITDWSGKMPKYTFEDGKKHADLQWIPLHKYKKYLKFDSAIFICEKLQEYILDNK